MIQIIWRNLNVCGIKPWFGWVISDLNIADRPRRYGALPFRLGAQEQFARLREASNLILQCLRRISEGSIVSINIDDRSSCAEKPNVIGKATGSISRSCPQIAGPFRSDRVGVWQNPTDVTGSEGPQRPSNEPRA